jgi:hypothetical protein
MPNINSRRMTSDVMQKYTISEASVDRPYQLPATANASFNSSNLMSITGAGGNSVPMRGVLPIEQMSDSDIARFFPYTAFFDRIPNYTYYQLFNRK